MATNNPFEGLISNPKISDDTLTGTIFLPVQNRSLPVELETDSEGQTLKDFEDLSGLVRQFLIYAGNGNLEQLRKEVSKEITESAYEQDDKLSADTSFIEERTKELEQDLELKELLVFDEGYVIEYASPSIFAAAQITVQLTTDFEIDDIAINE
jgi:hypothetical protein